MTRSRSINYTNDSYEFRAPYAAAAASLMANSYTMGESSNSRSYSSRPSSYYGLYIISSRHLIVSNKMMRDKSG